MKWTPEIKTALRRFLVMVLSLIVAYAVTQFVFRLDNFWIAVVIASVLSAVLEFLLEKYKPQA